MVRYCPACNDEFRPEIAVCSDCGGALILQPEGLGAAGAANLREADSRLVSDWRTSLDSLPISSLIPIRTFDALRDLEPVVGVFADIELPSRVLVQNGRYVLLVEPASVAEAQAALHAASPGLDERSDPSFDMAAGRYSHCPACAASLPEAFGGICPECGLELNSPSAALSVPEAE